MSEKDKLEQKIAQLEGEHAKGVQRLMGLRGQVLETEQTIARIEGAITVCRDLIREGIAAEALPADAGSPPPEKGPGSQSPTQPPAKK